MTIWTGTLPSWVVEPVTAADLDTMTDVLAALSDARSTYTPTFASSGTAPSLGNGTLSGRYLQAGKFVVATVRFAAGSTTTFGTGELRFGLPVTVFNSSLESIGGAVLLDAGTTRYSASPLAVSNSAYAQIVVGSSNFIQGTIPFTWTTNDEILFTILYEAA